MGKRGRQTEGLPVAGLWENTTRTLLRPTQESGLFWSALGQWCRQTAVSETVQEANESQ